MINIDSYQTISPKLIQIRFTSKTLYDNNSLIYYTPTDFTLNNKLRSNAVGWVTKCEFITNDKETQYRYDGNIYSVITPLLLGENTSLSCVKNDYTFYPEFINQIIGYNGIIPYSNNVELDSKGEYSISEIKYEDDYDFMPIIDKGSIVENGATLGYLKFDNQKFPISNQENLYNGVVRKQFSDRISFYTPINYIMYKDIEYPISLYNSFRFDNKTLPKKISNIVSKEIGKEIVSEFNKISLLDANDSSQFSKEEGNVYSLFKNSDIIIYYSKYRSLSSIRVILDNMTNFIKSNRLTSSSCLGVTNFPYYSEDFSTIVEEKLVSYVKNFIVQGFKITVLLEDIEAKISLDEKVKLNRSIGDLILLQGEYETKSKKNSSLTLLRVSFE